MKKDGKIMTALTVVFVLIFFGYFFYLLVGVDFARQGIALQIELTKAMIRECQECPEEALSEALHKTDPWGNDLMVKYNDGFLKSITIISCGPDGQLNTNDDITGSRHVKLDWKAGGEVLGEVGGDALQGVWRGLKRSFTGDKKEDQK